MIIDSNILIYAVNADSPKNKKSQEFLKESQLKRKNVEYSLSLVLDNWLNMNRLKK